MKDECVIINKTAIQQRIEELEKRAVSFIPAHEATICYKKLDELKQILSQSTPLIPEIEKAFYKGFYLGVEETDDEHEMEDAKQEYISNLKLDI